MTPGITDPDELRELGKQARASVQHDAERWFERADLADCYVACATDQLEQGSYTLSLQLLKRASEVCPSYTIVYTGLAGGAS